MKLIQIVIGSLFLLSSCTKAIVLNKTSNLSLLKQIDTTRIYEELNPEDILGYGVYKFYGNGHFKFFKISSPVNTKIRNREMITCTLGTLYKKNNKICGRFINVPSKEFINEMYRFTGDTLFVSKKHTENKTSTYIKRYYTNDLINFDTSLQPQMSN